MVAISTKEPAPSNDSSSKIFRRQAVEYAGVRRFGSVVLKRPIGFAIMTSVFVTIGVAMVAFVVLFGYTRKAHVPGVTVPSKGIVRVVPGQGGVISASFVQEKEVVSEGDPMFVVSSDYIKAVRGESYEKIRALMEARKVSLRAHADLVDQELQLSISAAEVDRSDVDARLRLLEQAISLQIRKVDLVRESAERLESVRESGHVSIEEIRDKRVELASQEIALAQMQVSWQELLQESKHLDRAIEEARINASIRTSEIMRQVSELDEDLVSNDAQKEIVVRASQSGVVTSINVEVGQFVVADSVIASLVPSGSFFDVELYAPSRAIGVVNLGDPVVIRYEAFPYQQFGQYRGYIREISSSPYSEDEVRARRLMLPLSTADYPVYRIRVAISDQTITSKGRVYALKPGMALQASILLNERKFYELLLGPLRSASERM